MQTKHDDFGSPVLRRGPWVLLSRDGWFFVAVDLPCGKFDVVWEGESVVEAEKFLARQAARERRT